MQLFHHARAIGQARQQKKSAGEEMKRRRTVYNLESERDRNRGEKLLEGHRCVEVSISQKTVEREVRCRLYSSLAVLLYHRTCTTKGTEKPALSRASQWHARDIAHAKHIRGLVRRKNPPQNQLLVPSPCLLRPSRAPNACTGVHHSLDM